MHFSSPLQRSLNDTQTTFGNFLLETLLQHYILNKFATQTEYILSVCVKITS